MFDEDFDFNGQDVPRIYDHTPIRGDFRSIDFNKQVIGDSLFGTPATTFGVVNSVTWLDAPQGDEVIEEKNEYVFQIPDFVQTLPLERFKTFTWFNRDGTRNPLTKVVHKIYTEPEQLVAASRRRQFLVSNLEAEIFKSFGQSIFLSGVTDLTLVGAMTAGAARVLRSYLEPGVNEFLISGFTDPLANLFTDSTEPLLNAPTAEFSSLREQAIARLL